MAYPYPYAYPPQPQPSASAPNLVVPRVVIGPQYCAPYPVDLAVVKKVKTIPDGRFVVTDINDNIIFKILKGSSLRLHERRVLVDAAGHPIVTLRDKVMTMHDRWEAFRGKSTYANNLIFTFKQSSLMDETEFDVFLANNTKEDVCDFKVKGSWSERSYIVYAGESNNVVAQMHTKHVVQSNLVGKDHFTITIYPNIDHAFIVALIVILDEIFKDANSSDELFEVLVPSLISNILN